MTTSSIKTEYFSYLFVQSWKVPQIVRSTNTNRSSAESRPQTFSFLQLRKSNQDSKKTLKPLQTQKAKRSTCIAGHISKKSFWNKTRRRRAAQKLENFQNKTENHHKLNMIKEALNKITAGSLFYNITNGKYNKEMISLPYMTE